MVDAVSATALPIMMSAGEDVSRHDNEDDLTSFLSEKEEEASHVNFRELSRRDQ